MKKILLTYAVKDEFVPVNLVECTVKYILTGVGKTRSAMMLTKAICEEKPDLVINMGTAGTLTHSISDIFICHRFIDRDFQSVKLPGIEYEIDLTDKCIKNDIIQLLPLAKAKTGTCNTGDSFVTEAESLEGDVVDMEAFAQAVVCKEFDIPFVAIKYVTDIIGQNSVNHWEDKLEDACKDLGNWLKNK